MKFRFDYDADRNRVLVEVRDLWTVETVRDFATASGAYAGQIRGIRVTASA